MADQSVGRNCQSRHLAEGRPSQARQGNFGDHKVLEDGLNEMRIDVGPGYRVYYCRIGKVEYLLVGGGDKSTQKADIKRAREVLRALYE